jgi:hypothetical protein
MGSWREGHGLGGTARQPIATYRNISDDCPVDHVGVAAPVNDEEQLLASALRIIRG